MGDWFTTEQIDADTFVLSEYRHWEETHCYLLNGDNESLLIDTGMGIQNIKDEVRKLTGNPVAVVATHTHWDHIGGHGLFPEFYVHEDEADWINGHFPLPLQSIKELIEEQPCDFPPDFKLADYRIFQGTPAKILRDGDILRFGGRSLRVLHTPGHSPGHMCFYEEARRSLFTGDLIYLGKLTAFFPSTNPAAYRESVGKIALLEAERLFPAHHSLDIAPSIISEVKAAFDEIERQGKLSHGAGLFCRESFQIEL